jgi:hypothetical protein
MWSRTRPTEDGLYLLFDPETKQTRAVQVKKQRMDDGHVWVCVTFTGDELEEELSHPFFEGKLWRNLNFLIHIEIPEHMIQD